MELEKDSQQLVTTDKPTEKPQLAVVKKDSVGKNPERSQTGYVGPVVVISLIVSFGGVLGGYSHGYPSPTLLDLQEAYEGGERVTAFSSSSIYAGLFAAVGPVGGLFGGFIAGPVSDRIGRSATLMLMTIPHLIGWLVQAYAQWMPSVTGFISVLMLGRWFTGFGTGWGSLVISIYLVEISPARLKGLFGSLYWFSTAIGILLVYGLGAIPGFTYSNLSLSTAALVLPCAILYCFLPETPRWLASKQRLEEANKVLQFLRGKDTDVNVELKELQANVKENMTWRNKMKHLLTNKSSFRLLVISSLLMWFQQFIGINVVVFYAGTILDDAQVVNPIQVAGFAVGATQVIAVCISVFTVDLAGRRVLLVVSSILVCISTGLLGLYYFLTDYVCVKYYHTDTTPPSANLTDLPPFCDAATTNFFVLAVLSVVLFIFAFSIGWATIPWVMMSELAPLRVRGALSSVATSVNWSSAALVTGLFPVYQDAVGHYGSWWTLTGITLLSIPFVLIFVPETRGESLEQIEKGLEGKYGSVELKEMQVAVVEPDSTLQSQEMTTEL